MTAEEARSSLRAFVKRVVARVVPPSLVERPSPVTARHQEKSLIFSADDEPGRPSRELIDRALEFVTAARDIDLGAVTRRIPNGIAYTEVWPGEHYKLLAGIVKVLQPRLVIEVGTATGLSALSLTQELHRGGRVVTFDLVPWREYPGHVLAESDFADGRLEQRLEDLSDPTQFSKSRDLVERAELIFVDAAKDGAQEQRFLDHFETCRFAKPPLIVFDDIRLWNMLRIWRLVKRPKLDLTSFGHWSGTGIVLWV
ncbi:MAG TPA: class I SAM-dependent methyltransferase [Planctomycetota bacterium]|nr:class I SAM-dependent methyltransferase [Planctomycetota bacterium]